MRTTNISLPESLKALVDKQVSQRGYGISSEYVRELICPEQDRLKLRNLLLAGASSAPAVPANDAYLLRQSSQAGTHWDQVPAQVLKPGMKAKSVVPRELTLRNVKDAVAQYLAEDAEAVALGFIDALGKACSHIGRHPATE